MEIKADQTSTVQFFNEKPEKPDNPKNPEKPSVPSNPSTPQKPVPQTGDDPYIFLYGGLLAAALIGGSVFAVYYFKKGKYSRTSQKRTAVGASVLSLCALVALGSGFLVFRDLNQYAESKDAYRDLAGYVEVPEQTDSPEQATDPTETKQDDADIVLPSVDFEALRENGPDIIGWLSLPDTVLNYPVTQTDNNEYYLNHLYDGTYNKVGCLFADYENRADFSDRNTIIYGHNMRDGSMFALLNRYDEQSYFDTHSGPGTGKRDQYTINNYISVYLPAILRCFRIAGFLFSKEGCYITQNEVNAVFDEQVRLCADTLKRKTKEYTGDDPDRLGAFKAAAALQHTTPQRALAGMLAKHIVSLYDMCFAEETVYPMDTWDEKITDSLNYLFLLKAIVKEGHTN